MIDRPDTRPIPVIQNPVPRYSWPSEQHRAPSRCPNGANHLIEFRPPDAQNGIGESTCIICAQDLCEWRRDPIVYPAMPENACIVCRTTEGRISKSHGRCRACWEWYNKYGYERHSMRDLRAT